MAKGVVLFLLASVPIALYIMWQHQDADFTLLFYEKFGRSANEELRGKVVWITGASGGIGENLAYELAELGAKLVLSARRKEELERVKAKCVAVAKEKVSTYHEGDIVVLPLDLAKFDTHMGLTMEVLKRFERIDILVNNAGRIQIGKAAKTSLKVDQALLDVNLIGVISLTKAVLPHMITRKRGQIVINGAGFGKFGAGNVAIYSASKFALHGYFDSLRIELLQHNVDVLMVDPGPVMSNLLQNSFTEEDNQILGKSPLFEQYMNKLKKAPTKVMQADRCAQLMTVAMVNKLDEVWLASNPVLLSYYLSQYAPTTFTWMSKKTAFKMPSQGDN